MEEEDVMPTCAICTEVLGSSGGPASLPCGHNGCLACLLEVQKHSSEPLCPICRAPFGRKMELRPNLELWEAIHHAHQRESYNYQEKQQQPEVELNLRNLLSGLFTLVTKGAQTRRILARGDYDCPSENADWNDYLLPNSPLPTAPPLPSAPLLSAKDDIRAFKGILEAEPPQWLRDSAAFACMQCAASFRPLTCGRHHCRFCGGIFCRSCSRGRCLMPVKFREREPQRVCDACYERLEPVQRFLVERVSNASQSATHDVTDLSCMRSWVNSPYGLSMEQEIYKATNALRSYATVGKLKPERAIPATVLTGAKGLAILTIFKAGFIVTYKIGTGLVLARSSNGSWSAPSAIACAGMGWGAQVGGEVADLIIVLRSDEAVKAFSGRVHFSFGAGLGIAAGPVGRVAEAEVRAGDSGAATCYSYSLSQGAFIGLSLEGSVVTTRSDTNARFYGDSYVTADDILSGAHPSPRAAAPLYHALHDLFPLTCGKGKTITGTEIARC